MGHEEAQLVGGRPAHVAGLAAAAGLAPARWPARPRRRCRRDAAAGRAAAGRRRGRARSSGLARQGARGNASGGSSGNDSTSVGPALPMCVCVEPGQLARRRPGSARSRPGAARRPRRAPRRWPGRQPRRSRPATGDPVADRHVDPPRADGRSTGSRGRRSLACRHRRRGAAADSSSTTCSAGRRSACGTCPSSCSTNASRIRSRSRRVRSHSSNWPSAIRSSMIRRDHRPDGRLVARRERADRGLDAVGEHDQRGLARLRLRAGVAELALVDGGRGLGALGGRDAAVRLGRQLLRPGVEVAHDRRPVVLRDVGDERLGQLGLVGEVDAVGDVLLEDLGADLGLELVVDVLAAGLVLDERRAGSRACRRRGSRPRRGSRAGRRRSPRPRARRGCRPSASGGTCRASRPAAGAAAAATGSRARAAGTRSGSRTPSRGPRTCRPRRRPSRPPRRADANHSSRTPRTSRAPSSEKTVTTSGVDDEHGDRGLDEDLQPVALADGDDAGHPAEEDVRRRTRASAPLTAPPMTATSAMTIVAIEASSRIASSIPMAAVGRKNWQDRPAGGDLERERRADDQQPDQEQDVVAMPERRPEPPDPAEQHPDDEDGEQEPADEARDVRARPRRGRARRSSRCRRPSSRVAAAGR